MADSPNTISPTSKMHQMSPMETESPIPSQRSFLLLAMSRVHGDPEAAPVHQAQEIQVPEHRDQCGLLNIGKSTENEEEGERPVSTGPAARGPVAAGPSLSLATPPSTSSTKPLRLTTAHHQHSSLMATTCHIQPSLRGGGHISKRNKKKEKEARRSKLGKLIPLAAAGREEMESYEENVREMKRKMFRGCMDSLGSKRAEEWLEGVKDERVADEYWEGGLGSSHRTAYHPVPPVSYQPPPPSGYATHQPMHMGHNQSNPPAPVMAPVQMVQHQPSATTEGKMGESSRGRNMAMGSYHQGMGSLQEDMGNFHNGMRSYQGGFGGFYEGEVDESSGGGDLGLGGFYGRRRSSHEEAMDRFDADSMNDGYSGRST